ncbi:hypothetical protein [uncultured Fibrobacter sp.]|uniref:hypothetical protein n=1 Tax=uncultured Fibrobacter sp. TaxID=261512 RepID=UPI00260C9339|nr:hypothetical protein [uncultured Fibrobacter sp.]
MGGFLSWLVLVACVLVLVALFFPFRFRAEFEAGEHGGKVRLFFFKKKLWSGEKKWGRGKRDAKAHENDRDLDSDIVDDDESFMPEFVATAPKPKVEKNAAPVATPPPAVENKLAEIKAQARMEPKEAEPVKTEPVKIESVKAAPVETASNHDAPEPAPEKKEKRKLTEAEFWTILLTPELDSCAFRYVKSLLGIIFKLFNIRFENCYVEGIRADYVTMGYGAAVNAVMKGFPYLESWDIRMDWCRDKDLCTAGTIHAKTNLCRVFFLLFAAVFYVAVLFLSFWRRRAHVLKTGELPELGFVRKKIVGWMVEE